MKINSIVLSMLYPCNGLETVWVRFYATSDMSKKLGYSHSGWASCHIGIDELEALMAIGFRPFARVSFDGLFGEEEDHELQRSILRGSQTKKTFLRFTLSNPEFHGGTGNYTRLAEAFRHAYYSTKYEDLY